MPRAIDWLLNRSSTLLGICVSGTALAVALPQPAAAQCTPNVPCSNEVDDPDRRRPPARAPLPVSQDLIAQRLIQQAHESATRTRQIVMNRLVSFPLGASSVDQNLLLGYASESDPNPEVVDPLIALTGTNDQPPALWNAWVDASVTYSDRGGTAGFEGPMVTISAGFDRTLGESLIVGFFGLAEHSNYDLVPAPSSLRSDSLGLGAYAGLALTDWLVADGLVQWQSTSNEYETPVSTASYRSDTFALAGNLTGYHFIDTIRLSPVLGVTWSQEDEDGFTDSLGFIFSSRTTETGVATIGGEVGKTFFLDNGGSIEPWLGATGEWTFQDTSVAPLDAIDVRLSGGINGNFSNQFSLTFRGDIAGLAIDSYLVGSGGIQAALRF